MAFHPRRFLRWRAASAAVVLVLAACGGGGGSDAPQEPAAETPAEGSIEQAFADATAYSVQPGGSLAQANEGTAISHHQLLAHGVTLAYTARAGHLVVKDSSGRPQASFFYVAYTLDGENAAQRPLTFFYNGGPGSASVWLHLGSFGPRRLATAAPSTSTPKPFALVANEETLLDASDLVFVDAIGTGHSQAVAPYTNQHFWGVDADAAAFRDFVQRYVAANQREASPKFLFGESYGTTRSAVLAELLETAGVSLKGMVLQSSVLDYNSNCGVTGQGSCAGYLPSYAATGAYHRLVNPPPADLDGFEQQMREFTRNSYSPALAAYLSQGTPPSGSLLSALAANTGASTSLWQGHFNLDPTTFQVNLLPNDLVGRYDARMAAPKGSALASEGDPSSTFISSQFASAIQSYLRSSLGYSSITGYVTLSDAINTWDFSHDGRALPDTVPDLATALTLNPNLKVLSVSGYHDLATPFFQTELDLARLGGTAAVQLRSYPGGHMTYLDDASRVRERADLQAFYLQAVAAGR
ncbi:S10 family peptidase [Ideonella sp. BN130291]|uniref:S10 family peptidase n=1 Tax=Ideonella sp. BN130291 TaxID=3112940 RepID=UPI002E254D90|nr:peptidase S10 [Ideonella sp. BN130291]